MPETTTTDPPDAPPLEAWIEQSLRRVAQLTKRAAASRRRAEAAIAERTDLVGQLVEAGVPLKKIAERAGVNRSALQWRAKR